MDTTDSGRITFTVEIFIWQQFCRKINVQDFVRTLSVLEKGSLLERMTWIARLYDLDGDGYIARDDLEDIIFSVGILSSQPFPLSLSLSFERTTIFHIFFSLLIISSLLVKKGEKYKIYTTVIGSIGLELAFSFNFWNKKLF